MKKRISESRDGERIIRFCKGALDDALSLVDSDDVDSDVIDEVIGTLKDRISILEDYLRKKEAKSASSLSENQKVTLTLGQLKKLVKESYGDDLSDLKRGDILYSSGGVSMTVVSFYQVVGVAGATVTLQTLGNKSVSGDHMSGRCVPDEKSKGRIFRRRFTRFGGLKGEYDSERLRKWNGEPLSYDFWD